MTSVTMLRSLLAVSVAAGIAAGAVLADDGTRVMRKEVVVQAPPADVWAAWTTSEGIASFFTPDSNIELRVGGPYELYMIADAAPGTRGSEGCRVLSYLPGEMFSFEWNFPPSIPSLRDAGAKTQVVLRFDEPEPGATRVRFTQLGWQEGEDWDAGYAYFDRAWSNVLGSLRASFAGAAPDTQPTSQSWIDRHVTVTDIRSPAREQMFEVTVAAPVALAWRALTTADGLREFIAPDPKVELAPGGIYEVFEGTGTHVQAFVPLEILAVTGSAPLEFPNVRMSGTWAYLQFEAAGENESLVRMTVLGWQEGDEWDRAFEYFLRNNAVFLNLLHERFTEGPLRWSQAEGAAHPTYTREPLGTLKAPTDDHAAARASATIAAPHAAVWKALTTTDALRGWSGPKAAVDLRIGSEINFGGEHANGQPLEILSYAPHRMLAHRVWPGAKAEDQPSACVVWRLESNGPERTDVVVDIAGWRADASAGARERAKATADKLLNKLQKHLASPKSK